MRAAMQLATSRTTYDMPHRVHHTTCHTAYCVHRRTSVRLKSRDRRCGKLIFAVKRLIAARHMHKLLLCR